MCGKSAKFWKAMPTPRFSGAASVTSRPSRTIPPESSVSTPATRRSSTVFPEPDGPKTQTISPGSIASDTSLRTALVLNALLTWSSASWAMMSAFHGAEGETLDEIALGVEGERKGRRHGQDDRRGDLPVLDARGGDEGERADRHRLLVRRRQDQGEDEIVPAEDEGEEPRRRDAGAREGNRDLRE